MTGNHFVKRMEVPDFTEKYTDMKFRILDLILVLTAMPLYVPVFVLISFAVLILQGPPIFFCAERVGRREDFLMIKFRSMVQGAPLRETSREMSAHVTSVGRFIRRTSVDELPQFINVLFGSMSLVGPRPCLSSQTNLLDMRRRLGIDNCRPGITGLAQVRGRDSISLRNKVRYEKFYASHQNVGLYFWILGLTIKHGVFGSDVEY